MCELKQGAARAGTAAAGVGRGGIGVMSTAEVLRDQANEGAVMRCQAKTGTAKMGGVTVAAVADHCTQWWAADAAPPPVAHPVGMAAGGRPSHACARSPIAPLLWREVAARCRSGALCLPLRPMKFSATGQRRTPRRSVKPKLFIPSFLQDMFFVKEGHTLQYSCRSSTGGRFL